MGDAAVSAGNEVGCCKVAATVIVNRDNVRIDRAQKAVDEDQRCFDFSDKVNELSASIALSKKIPENPFLAAERRALHSASVS